MTKKISKNKMALLGLMCGALVVCSVAFYQIQVGAEEFGGRKGGKFGGPHHMHGPSHMPGPPHHPQGPPPMEDAEFPKLLMFLMHDGEPFASLEKGDGPEGRPERGAREGRGRRGDGPDAKGGPHGDKGPGKFGHHKRESGKGHGPGKERGMDKRRGPGEGRGHHGGFGMKGPGHGGPFWMRGPGGPFGMRGHSLHGKTDPEIKKLMMGNMGRLMALRSEIDVTKEQREELRELMKTQGPQMHEKMGEVMKARKELMGQIALGEATEESINSSASKIADSIAAAALQAKSAREAAMAVFTEDQQSLIQEVLVKNMAARKEIHEKMKAKMEERKEKWKAKKLKKEEEGKSEKAEDDK